MRAAISSSLAEKSRQKQSQAADLYHTCDATTAPAVLIAAVRRDVFTPIEQSY
jgi:hypothetical protein